MFLSQLGFALLPALHSRSALLSVSPSFPPSCLPSYGSAISAARNGPGPSWDEFWLPIGASTSIPPRHTSHAAWISRWDPHNALGDAFDKSLTANIAHLQHVVSRPPNPRRFWSLR